jgi:hypothetical protein
MRAWMGASVLIALVGCGGDDDDTGITETCDDRVTSPLTDVPNADWPDGLDAAITAYKSLAGTWEGSNCYDDSQTVLIKIVTIPIEEIDIITSGISSEVPCGCVNDPSYGHDGTMSPVAIVPEIQVSIEVEDEVSIDPGIDNQTFQMSGGMFGANQSLLYRACATTNIEPYLESDYDQVAAQFRLAPIDEATLDADEGRPSLTFLLDTLTEGGATSQCDLTNLVKTIDPGQ